jgi:glycosyltransferase involved in cell wall biosynthesis
MTPQKTITQLATPVMPNFQGVGVEQRAARTLRALVADGPVDVVLCRPALVDRLRRSRDEAPPPGARTVRRGPRVEPLPAELLMRRVALGMPRSRAVALLTLAAERALPRTRIPSGATTTTGGADASRPVALLHAFRLASASALAGARDAREKVIDLDDLESEVARAIAELARSVGDHAVAAFYGALSRRLAALEAQAVARFDRVWLASGSDVPLLADRAPRARIGVLPNVVDVPPERRAAERRDGPTRFLYVGALAYYPNIDALRVLETGVLPRLRAMGRARFELHVVGRGAPRWLERRLRAQPEIVFHGAVPAMAPHYAQADAVVVPLRAGGGTRIKLLESFAHEVPVIATTTGAHGLDVDPGVHYVAADDEDAIAEACARFVANPLHAGEVVRAAYEHVRTRHHAEIFASRLGGRGGAS